MTVEETIKEVFATMKEEFKYGGYENGEGHLDAGTPDFDAAETQIIKSVQTALARIQGKE